MTEREGALLSFCRILAPPMPPPPTIAKYFTILMTEVRDDIIFVGFWRPPPPLTPQYLTIYLNDRERRAPLSFVGFWHPPPPPMIFPSQTPQYLTILLTEWGGGGWSSRALPFVGFWRPPPPPTPQYLTILMA